MEPFTDWELWTEPGQASNNKSLFSKFRLFCWITTSPQTDSHVLMSAMTQSRSQTSMQVIIHAFHSTSSGTSWSKRIKELATNRHVHRSILICENVFLHHKASSQQHSSHAITDQEHKKQTSRRLLQYVILLTTKQWISVFVVTNGSDLTELLIDVRWWKATTDNLVHMKKAQLQVQQHNKVPHWLHWSNCAL